MEQDFTLEATTEFIEGRVTSCGDNAHITRTLNARLDIVLGFYIYLWVGEIVKLRVKDVCLTGDSSLQTLDTIKYQAAS